jgi:hypothetical protein
MSVSPSKAMYMNHSLIKDYPFQFGKEYEPDYRRNPTPKPSIVDPKIFPTGKDDGLGPSRILNVYTDHVLSKSQRKHQTQEIRLSHFTNHFLEGSFEEQLESVELNNVPLASSLSIQKSLNKPNVSTDQKKFFVHLNNRLKNDDGLLIYARLHNYNINDTIVKFLCSGISRNTRLKILMLHNNFITDQGLELLCVALRHHPSLHTLWVGSNRITDFGIKSLSNLLSQNHTIKELNLSNRFKVNSFSKEEEDIRPYLTYISADYLANHLRKGSLLTTLVLSHQKLYDDGAILLYHSLPFCQVRSLNLTNNYLTNKSCLILQNILAKKPVLEQLILSKNQIEDNGAIAIAYGLAYNSTLSLLDLSENQVDEKGLHALYQSLALYNNNLRSLITVKNKVDDTRAESLAKTRNNSVFSLGLRSSMDMSRSFSAPMSCSPSFPPTTKDLRKSLLLSQQDGFVLDEIQNINATIHSILNKHGEDAMEAPKLIAKSLSRSILVRGDTEKSLNIDVHDADSNKQHSLDSRKSFSDLLKSPFGGRESLSPVKNSINVPGVGIYGQKSLLLQSIREEHTSGNINTSIQDAIAEALRIVNTSETQDDPRIDRSLSSTEEGFPDGKKNPRREIRKSQDLGKIIGIPEIKSIGIRPIRTKVGQEMDSGQHLMYLRVSTEADSEEARPYSLIKIGLDRIAEREKLMKQRQSEEYKEVKSQMISSYFYSDAFLNSKNC